MNIVWEAQKSYKNNSLILKIFKKEMNLGNYNEIK